MPKNPARELFEHLFDGEEGYLCIAGLERSTESMKQLFFQYPKQLTQAVAACRRLNKAGKDVYFCAHLLKDKNRKATSSASIRTLWADGDGATIPDGFPEPSAVVKSSDDKEHFYWRLLESVDPRLAEAMNRRIADAIGADPSGWDLTQLLRVPGTLNRKYSPPHGVVLSQLDGTQVDLAELEVACPELELISPRSALKSATRLKKDQAGTEPPVPLSDADKRKWEGKDLKLPGKKVDRSKALGRLAALLRANGADEEQIVDALAERDVALGFNKYSNRPDAEERYQELADWAMENVEPRIARQTMRIAGHTTGFAQTDLGNAERLAELFADALRYCDPEGWKTWDGTRWRPGEAAATECAALNARAIGTEAAEAPGSERNALWRHAERSEGKERIRAALELAKVMPSLRGYASEFDAHDDQLNTANGILDLGTGVLRGHDQLAFHSKLANVSVDPAADCPRFLEFIDETFAGEKELISYLQRVFGYCLTGSIEEQVFFLLYGSGANGKSTLVRVLLDLLDEYATQLPTETLLKQQNRAQTNDLARLDGSRVAVANEFPDGRKLDEALIKQLTGGERVTARLLYKDFVEIQPKCKILISSNYLPEITGTDLGIWRRVHVIPFTETVPEDRRDPQLNLKLRAELPGILNWALQGCLAWRTGGLNAPASVTEAVQAFRSEMDSVGTFIEEVCDVNLKVKTTSSDLYEGYEEWCQDSGARPVSKNRFLGELRNRGFQEYRSGRARGFRGIRVRPFGSRRDAA